MRSGLSSLATLLAFSVAGSPALAQLTVSPKLVEAALPDADFQKEFEGKQELNAKLRPNSNTAGVYFVYAKNTHATLDRTLVVELRGGKGEFLGEGRAEKVPAGSWKVVRFAKPAAPPAPPPAPAAAAAAVEPPPGVPVARGPKGFNLVSKLYDVDEKGNKAEVKVGGKAFEQGFAITFQNPTEYVTVGDMKYAGKAAAISLTAKEPGKSVAKITFPGQPDGNPPSPVTGVFARTLDKDVDGGNAVQLGGAFPNGLLPMHLAVDGVERVRVYEPAASAADPSDIKPVEGRRVRLIPVGGATDTKPTAAFAVRVETDNAAADDTLELHLRRVGSNNAALDEVIPLGGARDERLWVDVAEPAKQGLGFATKTADWVKAIDLSSARGKVEVEAALVPDKKTDKSVLDARTLFVDADPPAVTGVVEVGDPAKPKERLLKGAALPVRATVTDGAGTVQKVTFVLFTKLLDDGTFSPDAVKADGVRQPKLDPKTKKPSLTEFTDVWAADITPPADKKGRFLIAAVAADKAGNESKVGKVDPSVKVIEIVDPAGGSAVARGSISGIVLFAGRPQPGLAVVVGGGDGKAKAVAYTNDAGKFCIPNLLPGSYLVLTAKTDTNKGFSSQADVTVESEKTAKVTLELIRNKDGR